MVKELVNVHGLSLVSEEVQFSVYSSQRFVRIIFAGREKPRELERPPLLGALRPAARLQAQPRREAKQREGRLQQIQV